ncbi:hypothetical protein DM01DRAFT_1407758 [Hesseltinella vesiculosa]|uniref:Uncharacterized protein n=1 Tax=Hesseltinella vesiculosa TaxID=101127 RepID=A0A1X2GH81_9FUNG|nr:hypothetical protein DM01DRAFT_1407758 [Hesseltinella vesiculosa]
MTMTNHRTDSHSITYIQNSLSNLMNRKRRFPMEKEPPPKRLSLTPLTNTTFPTKNTSTTVLKIPSQPIPTDEYTTEKRDSPSSNEQDVLRLYARYLQWEWVAIGTEQTVEQKKSEIKCHWDELQRTYNQAQYQKRLKDILPYDQDLLMHEWRSKHLGPIRRDLNRLVSQADLPSLSDYRLCDERLGQAIAHLERLEQYLFEDVYRKEMDKLNKCTCLMKEMKKEYLDIRYRCATWNLD